METKTAPIPINAASMAEGYLVSLREHGYTSWNPVHADDRAAAVRKILPAFTLIADFPDESAEGLARKFMRSHPVRFERHAGNERKNTLAKLTEEFEAYRTYVKQQTGSSG